jgi:hypothetical protein
MPGLRGIVQNAGDRKRVPVHRAGSIRDLALQLGMTVPISIRGLVVTLNRLPPAIVIFNSPEQGPSTVSGSAQLGLQSDGCASFFSHVRESGAIGHNYFFSIALLDVVDAQGKMLVFVHEGTVHGILPGDRDDDKQTDGFNPFIADQWNNVKNSGFEAHLHVSTNPIQALESLVVAFYAARIIALAAVGVAIFVSDPKTKCDWRRAPNGDGADLNCHKDISENDGTNPGG